MRPIAAWAKRLEAAAMIADWREVDAVRREMFDALPSPIPMFLTCPKCNARHVDQGEFATKPHHTHSCQECGLTWRPAVVHTVGVAFLPGFQDAEYNNAMDDLEKDAALLFDKLASLRWPPPMPGQVRGLIFGHLQAARRR